MLNQQLADLCLSGDTTMCRKHPPAGPPSVAIEADNTDYDSDFEDAEGEESGAWGSAVEASIPAVQQLLGRTRQGSAELWGSGLNAPTTTDHIGVTREQSGSSATLRQGICVVGEGGAPWPTLDEASLSVGLPKAGLGFGVGVVVASEAVKSPVAEGGKRPTAMSQHGVEEPLTKPPSFSFSPPLPPKGGRCHTNQAPSPSATSKIRLREALTNRAAFLKRELEDQLGGELRLKAACDAVRASLHSRISRGGDEDLEWSDGEMREVLSGIVSPVHIELAPLIDELVLLQERFYA